jgi:hypothetical protein
LGGWRVSVVSCCDDDDDDDVDFDGCFLMPDDVNSDEEETEKE